jgi:hypothetical protein
VVDIRSAGVKNRPKSGLSWPTKPKREQEKGIFKKGNPYIKGHMFYGLLFSFMYTQVLMQGKRTTGIELKEPIGTVIDTYLHRVEVNDGHQNSDTP